jgi:HEPN domain-containing protein
MRNHDYRKTELFDKAIGDYIVALLAMNYRPDYAAYHVHQSVEKLIKGAIVCIDPEYDISVFDHHIPIAVKELSRFAELPESFMEQCGEIQQIFPRIRYQSRKDDPNAETLRGLVASLEEIMNVISNIWKCIPLQQRFTIVEKYTISALNFSFGMHSMITAQIHSVP